MCSKKSKRFYTPQRFGSFPRLILDWPLRMRRRTVSRCPTEERWTRKKRSDWMLKCIDTFLIHTHIIFFLSIRRFRENILNIYETREECERGTEPAVERQIKSVSRPSRADGYLPATEGSTIRQRPRLLLGRSVCYPHLNVAFEFFNISSFSGFGFSLFLPLTGPFDPPQTCRSAQIPPPTMLSTASGLRRLTLSHGILVNRRPIFDHGRNLSANAALAAKVLKTPPGLNVNPTHTSFDQARIAEVDLMKGPPPPLRDNFGRMHNYLRISACLSSPCAFRSGVLNKHRPYRTV